ncbi:hypothetical protein OC25_15255 [Pedobacter kyungheensis]|uniref:Uncharacterized protein n=1 Tax=Pedobacter kyungheensis TaxID=1069985 RepID=A0A0C1D6L4_9SPHI|nr:hypothetical protein [Pedobacter kyungheensis]KIA92751.1 hypothetical protein OC25_15255 [Pedobacter kyungheensis]
MQEPKKDSIPRSILKEGNTIRADLNHPKGKGKMLFISPKCSVIGISNSPHLLFATPDFYDGDLPFELRKHIYMIKELVFQPTFRANLMQKPEYYAIPVWLSKFKTLEEIRFRYVKLEGLEYLIDLPIHHIILEHVKYTDNKTLLVNIKKFKYLKEISYDQSLPAEIISSINRLKIRCTIIKDVD